MQTWYYTWRNPKYINVVLIGDDVMNEFLNSISSSDDDDDEAVGEATVESNEPDGKDEFNK